MEIIKGFEVVAVPLIELLINLSLSIILAVIWAVVVSKTTRLITDTRQYFIIFILLIPAMVLIISIIKSSIALSLGLVGALSIVRFRTPIKEPEELLYIFVAIGVGLGLGAGQVISTISCFFVICVTVVVHGFFAKDKQLIGDYFIDIHLRNEGGDYQNSRVIDLINEKFPNNEIKRIYSDGSSFQVVINLPSFEKSKFEFIQREISNINPNFEFSIVENRKIIT